MPDLDNTIVENENEEILNVEAERPATYNELYTRNLKLFKFRTVESLSDEETIIYNKINSDENYRGKSSIELKNIVIELEERNDRRKNEFNHFFDEIKEKLIEEKYKLVSKQIQEKEELMKQVDKTKNDIIKPREDRLKENKDNLKKQFQEKYPDLDNKTLSNYGGMANSLYEKCNFDYDKFLKEIETNEFSKNENTNNIIREYARLYAPYAKENFDVRDLHSMNTNTLAAVLRLDKSIGLLKDGKQEKFSFTDKDNKTVSWDFSIEGNVKEDELIEYKRAKADIEKYDKEISELRKFISVRKPEKFTDLSENQRNALVDYKNAKAEYSKLGFWTRVAAHFRKGENYGPSMLLRKIKAGDKAFKDLGVKESDLEKLDSKTNPVEETDNSTLVSNRYDYLVENNIDQTVKADAKLGLNDKLSENTINQHIENDRKPMVIEELAENQKIEINEIHEDEIDNLKINEEVQKQ